MTTKRVRAACFAIATLLALGTGCGGGASDDSGDAPAEEVAAEASGPIDLVAAMEQLAEEACACIDQPCAKKIDERVREIFDSEEPPENLSEEDMGKVMMSMFQAAGCLSQYGV